MKRFLLLALAIVITLCLGACGGKDNNNDEATTLNTSESIETSTEIIVLPDEEQVKYIISGFASELTGLTEDVDSYFFKVSSATFNGETAQKAEAYLLSNGKLEGVFFIVGNTCYKYDSTQNKYYKLTEKVAEEVKDDINVVEETEVVSTTEKSVDVKTEQDIADENKDVLVSRYEKYDLSVVGLPKPISEYEFQTTGKMATASDGEKVFVIYLLENGVYTEFTFAVGADKDYYFDKDAGEYKPLS